MIKEELLNLGKKSKNALLALAFAAIAFPSDAPYGRLNSYLQGIEDYTQQYHEDIICERFCTCEPVVKHVHHEKIVPVPVENKYHVKKKENLADLVKKKYLEITDTEFERINNLNTMNRVNKFDKVFERNAERYDVDKNLMKGIAFVESRGRHKGIVTTFRNGRYFLDMDSDKITKSAVGALGMMQLMPATARELGVNPFNVYQNIRGATKLMRKNIRHFEGNIVPAITSYNAGIGLTNKLIKKARSFDFLEYRKFGKSPEIKKYTLNVLVAKKLFDNYEDYTENIVQEDIIY